MTGSNAYELRGAQYFALVDARSSLVDDIERGLDFLTQPEYEDGGHPTPDVYRWPPFGWSSLVDRMERLEALELAFAETFGAVYAHEYAEGC